MFFVCFSLSNTAEDLGRLNNLFPELLKQKQKKHKEKQLYRTMRSYRSSYR